MKAPPMPPKPRHCNDTLGHSVIEPPTAEALRRVQQWRHRNRERLTFNRIMSMLSDPKSYA